MSVRDYEKLVKQLEELQTRCFHFEAQFHSLVNLVESKVFEQPRFRCCWCGRRSVDDARWPAAEQAWEDSPSPSLARIRKTKKDPLPQPKNSFKLKKSKTLIFRTQKKEESPPTPQQSLDSSSCP